MKSNIMNFDKHIKHISIIMDGNGRWAIEKGAERLEGHKKGKDSVKSVIEAAIESGIDYLSLYAFSEENWGRPQSEVDGLMSLMFRAINDERETLMKNDISFIVLGNRDRLSMELNNSIHELEKMTENNSKLKLIIFLSYSGKWDILQAIKRIANELEDNELTYDRLKSFGVNDIDKYLVTRGIPDPDMIIRTAGEQRLSNYMLWQSAYSEFIFVNKLWPDFGKEDFFYALEEFSRRERRFGKV